MDIERFRAIVEAYGADPRRWPKSERAATEAFARANADAVARVLADARALDGVLDAAALDLPGDLLAARILARAPKPGDGLSLFGDRRAIIALAACALIGLVAGFAGSRALAPADAADTIISATFGDPDLPLFGDEG